MDPVPLTIEQIQNALTGSLPGVTGQKKMAPYPATDNFNRWDTPDNCRDAGVLLLLYPYSPTLRSLYLALIRRPEYPGAHSGQVALPGGRREDGETLKATALRETEEEIGVRPATVQLIGRLSRLYTPPSNYCIYPFVAYRATRPRFALDPREVAHLIEAPLRLFLDPRNHKEETWHFKKYGARQIPFFDVFGHKVWGATAMILSEFLTLLTSPGD